MKHLVKYLMILVIIFTFSCSEDNQEAEQLDSTKIINTKDASENVNRTFTCQSFTIGISFPFTIETQVHYCCVGDELCIPTPGTVCVGCGFVNDSDFEEIENLRISVKEIDKKILSKSIIVSSSSEIKLETSIYKIKCKEYFVDKNGFITLEFEKK